MFEFIKEYTKAIFYNFLYPYKENKDILTSPFVFSLFVSVTILSVFLIILNYVTKKGFYNGKFGKAGVWLIGSSYLMSFLLSEVRDLGGYLYRQDVIDSLLFSSGLFYFLVFGIPLAICTYILTRPA